MTYELSVVIPTKNRSLTALDTARLAAGAGSASEVEVIVQDCSQDERLATMLADEGLGSRVQYQYTGDSPTMTENWNRAIARARGEYVIVIGDDDTVCEDVLSIVRWARANDLDAVRPLDKGFYWFSHIEDAALAGTLVLPKFSGGITIYDAPRRLRECTTTGDLYYQLPMVYHNLVRREVLTRIHDKSGTYVDGSSPDLYSAFAIACEIERYGEVDYPITLVGACATSNTNRQRKGEQDQHFREFGDYRFTWVAPESMELIATNLDNMVRAFENLGRHDLIGRVDYLRVFARTMVVEPRRAMAHFRKFLRVSRRMGANPVFSVIKLLAAVLAKIALVTMRRIVAPVTGAAKADREEFSGVPTLSAALEQQARWLAEHGVKRIGIQS